jgi:predicted dehydrogenase
VTPSDTEETGVRVGVLGAARIVKGALLDPIRQVDGVTVAAVAARDPRRAQAYANKHSIPLVYDSYERLLADSTINAVYIPLPAALHAEWMLAAIEAGKHVLCEKPFTSNAAAAERVAATARGSGVVVMEAYHSQYHPLQDRLRAIIDSGEIGTVTRAEAAFCVPITPGRDIRWNLALGGGGLLDVGYYPVRALRDLLGEITAVRSARAWQRGGVDRLLIADVTLGDQIPGRVVSSIWSRHFLGMKLEIHGTRGRVLVTRPFHPHVAGSQVRVWANGGRRVETTSRKPTYLGQLEAFRDAAVGGAPVPTDAAAALAQMRALDLLYATAGMPPRP